MLRHHRLWKGSHEPFFQLSETGVWPWFARIGARITGQWVVVDPEGQTDFEFDDVYRLARYASFEHWQDTRGARSTTLGGNGPARELNIRALQLRREFQESSDGGYFLQGVTATTRPFYLPGVTPGDDREAIAIRHDVAARTGAELVTLTYERIHKGAGDDLLGATVAAVWPFEEKLGARPIGQWKVKYPLTAGRTEESDYDEMITMTRYASYGHYQAVQPGQAVRLGGNGPDWEAWRDAMREHSDRTIDARVQFLEGFLHQSPPVLPSGCCRPLVDRSRALRWRLWSHLTGCNLAISMQKICSMPACALRIVVIGLSVALMAASSSAQRPLVGGPHAAVSAGHPLTTAAAFETLLQGGNAFDAGVTALLVGGVIEQDLYGLGGESLILVYPQAERVVTSIVGQGWAPRQATIDWYRSRNKDLNGEGLDPGVVPGALHGALTVLERWGTMSFEQVAARAIDYAAGGFPLRALTARAITGNLDFIGRWPLNQQYWLKPDGSVYKAGETITLPTLANTLNRMVEAERAQAHQGRAEGIVAARDRFYKGDIAAEMVAFLQANGAPFELSDFAEFYAKIEEPTHTEYRGYTVYKQGFGSQGPVLLQTLNILEQFDLQAMGHNSPDYVHTITEAMKLAYADRDTYYADPEFVDVPAAGLLSKAYAKTRGAEIDPDHASTAFKAGDPLPYDPEIDNWPYWVADIDDGQTTDDATGSFGPSSGGLKDTSHIAIIDKDGNVFDATPSGGWVRGAVILGNTGIGLSTRGEQFWLDEDRANHIRPRARPRYTLTPSLVLRDGEPFMALGTPGGDNQDQTILQSFLNIVEFWPEWYPNLHDAIAWPRVRTQHLQGSFWPHAAGFNQLDVESAVSAELLVELRRRGHEVNEVPPLGVSGCATVVMIDPGTGNRLAAADPRRDCYAIAH
jgi:gamma-glutamyltranspeptidase/glutathione hydrolase